MTDIPAGGKAIVLKFCQPVLLCKGTIYVWSISHQWGGGGGGAGGGEGQPIVLKFWKSVLFMQIYNLCIEHNFVRIIDFLI